MSLYNIYMADLETDSDKTKEPFVWFCGFKSIYEDEYFMFTNIENMIDKCWELDSPVFYYHNGGRFDTRYLYDLFFMSGFFPVEKLGNIKNRKQFKIVASINNTYDIHLYWNNKTMVFRDSYKLIPRSIKSLGGKLVDLDHTKFRRYESVEEVADKEPEVIEYFKGDLDIPSNMLKADLFYGPENCKKELLPMAMAGYGMKLQKKHTSFIRYNLMNKLTVKQWDYFKNFLRGGIVYCNPQYLLKKCYGLFKIYDFNSLYPFILWNFKLPYGIPLKEPPKNRTYNNTVEVYINKATLKKGNIPFMCDKIDEVYKYFDEREEFWYYCWDFEWEYIKSIYNLEYEDKYIKKWYFCTSPYLRSWVDKLYFGMRIPYQQKGDKINEQAIKLILNGGGYGKYVQKRITEENYFRKIQIDRIEINPKSNQNEYWSGEVKYRSNTSIFKDINGEYWLWDKRQSENTDTNRISYNPLGSFITAQGRVKTHTLWNRFKHAFMYGDTDSIIINWDKMSEEDIKEIDNMCDNTNLGWLKHKPKEDISDKFYCYASKKYWFNNSIKIAGMTLDDKLSFDTFADTNEFEDSKTFIIYVNGKPVIEKRKGVLNARKKD